jgi:hypothetical protein
MESYDRLAGYGAAGRQNYLFRNVTIDVLLPLSVFPSLFLLIRRAIARFSFSRLVTGLFLSVPFVYVAFDLLERFGSRSLGELSSARGCLGGQPSLYNRRQTGGFVVCGRHSSGNAWSPISAQQTATDPELGQGS